MNQLKTYTAAEIANIMVGQHRDPSGAQYVLLADATAREAQLVDAAREVIRTELFFQDHPQKFAAQQALRAAVAATPAAPALPVYQVIDGAIDTWVDVDKESFDSTVPSARRVVIVLEGGAA